MARADKSDVRIHRAGYTGFVSDKCALCGREIGHQRVCRVWAGGGRNSICTTVWRRPRLFLAVPETEEGMRK